MSGQRVPEEDHGMDLAAGDRGADLQVAALRPAGLQLDGQTEMLADEAAGRTGGHEMDTREDLQVRRYQIEEVVLLLVVGDQRHGGASRARSVPRHPEEGSQANVTCKGAQRG